MRYYNALFASFAMSILMLEFALHLFSSLTLIPRFYYERTEDQSYGDWSVGLSWLFFDIGVTTNFGWNSDDPFIGED